MCSDQCAAITVGGGVALTVGCAVARLTPIGNLVCAAASVGLTLVGAQCDSVCFVPDRGSYHRQNVPSCAVLPTNLRADRCTFSGEFAHDADAGIATSVRFIVDWFRSDGSVIFTSHTLTSSNFTVLPAVSGQRGAVYRGILFGPSSGSASVQCTVFVAASATVTPRRPDGASSSFGYTYSAGPKAPSPGCA